MRRVVSWWADVPLPPNCRRVDHPNDLAILAGWPPMPAHPGRVWVVALTQTEVVRRIERERRYPR